jgi:hypothetical protein
MRMASVPREEPLVWRLDDIEARPIRWLWPGRIPGGKLSLLDGDPNQGKSLFTLDLCARITRGDAFPDGIPGGKPGHVLLVTCEDELDDTILPRLKQLGAVERRVHSYQGFTSDGSFSRLPSFPRDAPILEQVIRNTGSKLVVIDPLMAFLDPTICGINDQSVRQALMPLALVAEATEAALLLVRHLNKSGGNRAIYRGSGSIGIIGSMRMAYLMARDPEDPDVRVLACTKSNIGPPPSSLAFRVEKGEGDAPRVVWLGPSELSADDLVATRAPRLLPRQQACDFLQERLQKGSREVKELEREAAAQGISKTTLLRAKKELKVFTRQERHGGKPVFFWSLTPPEEQDVPGDDLPILPRLEPMRLAHGPGSDRL